MKIKGFLGFKFRFFTQKNIYYLKKLRYQFQKSKISFSSLILPIFITIGASVLEGASLGLLIPTLNGVTTRDFSAIKSNHYYRTYILNDRNLEFLHNDTALMILLFVAIFITVVGKNILLLFSNWGVAMQVRRLSNFLRKNIYERYLSFGKLYFEKYSLGYLHQLLTTYVDTVALEFRNLQAAVYALCTLLVYFSMMLYISVKLTLIVLLIFPVLHHSSTKIITRLRNSSKEFAEKYNTLGKKISNALNCIQLVKAYSTEKNELEEFNKTSDQVRELQFTVDKNISMVYPIQEIILLCFTFVLVGIISYVASSDNNSSVSQYLVFILILRRASGNFGAINAARTSLASLSGPLQEVASVFDNETKYIVKGGTREFSEFKEFIELRNLNFIYPGGNKVLNDVEFKIERGKVTALVGQSGSGKSTIINLLMRFYDCEPGCILVDGIDIREYSLNSWLKNVALVTQEAFLLNDTFRANLTYGLNRNITSEDLDKAVKGAKLQDLINKLPLGLDTEVGDKGSRLSGGEKQRLSIARAILKKPEILILDEPTSALDSTTEKQIQATINEVFANKTLVVIAHRLATVQNADKIIVLEKGKVVEKGAPKQLLAQRGKFHSYWEAQHLNDVISQM